VKRRPKWRPYIFEIVLAINALWVFWMARGNAVATMRESALNAGLKPLYATLGGIAIRFVFAAVRGHGRRYLQIIANPRWIVDTLRLLVAMVFLAETYGWIKLLRRSMTPLCTGSTSSSASASPRASSSCSFSRTTRSSGSWTRRTRTSSSSG
jgi:uncharacterized membrane protein YgcG